MHFSLASKFSATILGVVALAVVSSLVTLYGAWRVSVRLDEASRENLPGARAEEVEISLLEGNNMLAAYLLEKSRSDEDKSGPQVNPRTDQEKKFRKSQAFFKHWIAAARGSGDVSDKETGVLAQLEKAWDALDARRDEVLALAEKGEFDRARTAMNDVDGRLTTEVRGCCRELIAMREQQSGYVMSRAARRTRLTTLTVGASSILTLLLGGFLLWLFFYRVMRPLRGMVADAETFRGAAGTRGPHSAADELRLMGDHFRELMNTVSDTRTRLERSHRRLDAAQKLASVGKLAASVAHEIRNPLTAMKMWLFSIQETVEGNTDLVRRLAIVSEEIARLESIVREFLEFSRPPEPQLQPRQVREVVDQTLELLAPRLQSANVRAIWTPRPGLPPAMIDRGQIKQVLLNLLGNALDAMPDGGEIRVTAVAAKNANGQAMLVLRICDTGPGMPPDVQARVFEPFFSTKESGTGLGLCIAAQVMARHQGALVLESSTDKGTTFAVWMPLATDNTAAVSTGESDDRGKGDSPIFTEANIGTVPRPQEDAHA